VGRDRAAALRAFAELRRVPAVRRFARAQAHLRGFAFWDSHEANQESRKSGKDNLVVAAAVSGGILFHL
jgi:hypothetical protein